MRFLLDQDVYAVTTRFLMDLGHDVVSVAEIGCSQAADEELLNIAQEQGRIFVTRDRDFGMCRTQGTRDSFDVVLWRAVKEGLCCR